MNNEITQSTDGKVAPFCTKTFEVSGTQVKNTYLCNQPRFTVADSWNLLKQKNNFQEQHNV